MILVLLRHGRTEANEQRLYCGCTDLPLSENGRKELLERKNDVSYPSREGLHILTSGMRRTNETLELLYGTTPEAIEAGFMEMNFGRFEMHSYQQLKNDPEYIQWIMDNTGKIAPPGGESRDVFCERVQRAVDGLEGDCLIVTHGGVITQIMAYLFPEENKGFYEWQPACGCGYRVDTEKRIFERVGGCD